MGLFHPVFYHLCFRLYEEFFSEEHIEKIFVAQGWNLDFLHRWRTVMMPPIWVMKYMQAKNQVQKAPQIPEILFWNSIKINTVIQEIRRERQTRTQCCFLPQTVLLFYEIISIQLFTFLRVWNFALQMEDCLKIVCQGSKTSLLFPFCTSWKAPHVQLLLLPSIQNKNKIWHESVWLIQHHTGKLHLPMEIGLCPSTRCWLCCTALSYAVSFYVN